jgi:amino acid adenylation domain-containing protein
MNKNLSPAKRALLEKWLHGQANGDAAGIPRRPADSPAPLSFPQRRQLFLELLNRGSAVNNLSVMLLFKGKLAVGVLEQSANRIIERHESLRTQFHFGNGLPVPEVVAGTFIPLPVLDLQHLNAPEQMTTARWLAEKNVLQPFDLTKAPLIRLQLYTLSNDQYLFLVVVHHAVADGWSLGVFLKELTHFYREMSSGHSNPLPALSIQYADYSHWQTGAQSEMVLQASLDYWTKQLGGELPLLELPADGQRSARQTYPGGTHRFIIPKPITEAFERLNREADSTLFMALLTVYAIILHRYSGQDDIIVGTPVANRNRPGLENLIGVFINTLSLRIKLAGNTSFRELLKQVRKLCTEAYAHQDLPFEKIVEALKPQRDLRRTPIFQTVFNLQNSPLPKPHIPGVETSFLEIDRGVSQFDLTLMISKLEGQCHATVEYNNELFTATTIERMFRSYHLLLEAVIARPDELISSLPILSKEEEEYLVNGLNKTGAEFPREKCLHQLFELQVEQTPDAVAIVYNQQATTYLDLNRHANALAEKLQTLGVGPENRVGIWLEKSTDLVVALLGVLKAGGTYVPIQPLLPEERVQFMLKDADVNVLLTAGNSQPLAVDGIPVVNLHDASFADGFANLQSTVTPANLAYIIYTSGSTGQPKGVMVSHSALVNFLWSMRQRPGLKKEDVLLSVTSISFDIAALELFLPLLVGATVVLADKEMIANPVSLGQAIPHHKITVMQATPATWQSLLAVGWSGEPGLKALCGGEALTRKLANQLLDRVDELWNMYGPTETTVWSSVQQVQKDGTPITIGKPIANTQLYVLDAHLQPLPVGVAGELHIGGEGLSRGYQNNVLLTKEKFIHDPFSSQPNSRLYRTGDRARYLADLSIEILGRNDDQVKVNGHRVELGEIATVLMQHPAVQKAIALTQTETNGAKQLIAYVVTEQGTIASAGELQDFVRKKLPSYMIPSPIICLEDLPLTPNGKIDRKALPAPKEIRQLPGYMAPRNKTEQLLASIWQDVLEVKSVGINDNFFDLGGASLQSLEMVAKATMLGLPLTVEAIFENQTIAELSAHLKTLL